MEGDKGETFNCYSNFKHPNYWALLLLSEDEDSESTQSSQISQNLKMPAELRIPLGEVLLKSEDSASPQTQEVEVIEVSKQKNVCKRSNTQAVQVTHTSDTFTTDPLQPETSDECMTSRSKRPRRRQSPKQKCTAATAAVVSSTMRAEPSANAVIVTTPPATTIPPKSSDQDMVTQKKNVGGRPKKRKRGRKPAQAVPNGGCATSPLSAPQRAASQPQQPAQPKQPTQSKQPSQPEKPAQPEQSVQSAELEPHVTQKNPAGRPKKRKCGRKAAQAELDEDAAANTLSAPQRAAVQPEHPAQPEQLETLMGRCREVADQWQAPTIQERETSAGGARVAQCVAAATMNQSDLGNLQCVVMASCGAAYSVALQRAIFSTADMDTVLRHANRIYYGDVLRGDQERLIEPEDMVTSFEVGSFKFITGVEYVFSDMYPETEAEMNNAVSKFAAVLTCMFEDRDHDSATVSFLMTGNSETISFWRKDCIGGGKEYYVFNSHAVGESGLSDYLESRNLARLFKVDSLHNLAKFLFINSRYGQRREFQIHLFRVYEFFTTNRNDNNNVTLIEDTNEVASLGRPKKVQLGRPKEKENAHWEAVKRYSQKHPETNRKGVKKYSQEHPEVNRETSQTYRESHSEQVQLSNRCYNRSEKRYQSQLNRTGLIGEKCGEALSTIPVFTLKKTLLDTNNACQHCRAKKFNEELSRLEWCCGRGKYNVLHDILPPLDAEFYNDQQFIRHARAYNNMFAFSASGVTHGFQYERQGISFVKIQGRIYHRVFDLGYNATTNPIGLYIDDGEERKRLAENQNLNQSIIQQIDNYLNAVNPFIPLYRRLSLETSEESYLMFQHTNRRTHGNILGDMPRGSEVAAIISTDREEYVPRSIAIWNKHRQSPHTVDIFHPLYEAFQYPLLYPHGCAGWIPDMVHNNIKVSQTKYYRCLLLSEPRFSDLGRLSDEWLVDMYCRVEEERLRFLKNRQNVPQQRMAEAAEIRQVHEQLNNDETIQGEGGVVPGKIYLPNTFTGAPRYMKTKYMDAIALVNRLGKPSYFLTMTCNPKWPEIVQNTPPGMTPSPALCARVFELKHRQLLNDLKSGLWFGKIEYLMYVIEWQKRGLPHSHICFRVEGGGPTQNIDIDKVVRADIPSADEAGGRLRAIVLKHMIHGPCGPDRTDIPCWDHEKKRCSKHFPKQSTETTYVDQRGFVMYKRNPNNKGTVLYRNRPVEVDDTWVVSYNAPLMLKYDCHINLEISSARKVVKYLFKYITKGPDEARVAIVPDELINDEIEQYVTKRYIGACNAAWRIFEFTITSREPNVKQLTVHLEDRQVVTFRKGQEAQAVESSSSDLLKYFNRPTGPEFDSLTFQDFYEHYILHTKMPQSSKVTVYKSRDDKYFVTKRQRGEMVTRLFWVAPNRGEQFYLRMLLGAFPCRSYAELKALGGADCTTFQEAARVTGLANDEDEYERCIQEAAGFYTGRRLRHFFVLIITTGAPAAILWDKYKHLISEDYLERHPNDEAQAYAASLREIDRLLRKQGSCVMDHGLPSVPDDSTELSRERVAHDISRLSSYVEHWLPQLSTEQKAVFDNIKTLLTNDNVNDDMIRCVFLDGPSGTGKTLLLNVITAYVRGVLKQVAICTASSGIAAQNYEGGCTAHSMFRLPLEIVDDNGYWNLTNGTQRAELIREASLIIYDEAPMSHKYLIQLLDRSLRDLMNSPQPFGGKTIIFSGDFRQIPPVVTNARSANDVVNASLKTSPLWPVMRKFSLKQAQRTRSDEEYSEFLLDLGSGKYNTTENNITSSTALISLQGLDVVTELIDLMDFVFPPEILNNPDVCARRAIITTHNNNVREINSLIVDRIEGEYQHCFSADSVNTELASEFHLGTDLLNNVQVNGVPDHDLKLKKGAVCMIMRNLSFADGLVNGTKVVITDISPRLLTVRKPGSDDIYLIPRISFNVPIEQGSPIEMCRRQFPVQLSYAMTVHKSQGQTIEKVGIDLRSDVFSHGQLYVALGRVRNKCNIRILIQPAKIISDVPCANNVLIPALIE